MSSLTPHQPTLPVEGTFTDAELTFLDESPPGLFPENQDSNFGFMIRKIFSDLTQDIINWQTTLYNEHFASTSSQFLDQWEIDVGLPPNPQGISIPQQRNVVLARLQRGPFTRARRNAVIEGYIQTTFGTPIQLVPAGVAFDGTGIPIFGESGNPTTFYRVYEDQTHFSYGVWITSSTNPDMNSLTRELKRITPAGISFTVDNTKAGVAILNYGKEILNDGPALYYRMDNSLVDSSGYGNNATLAGGVVAGASLVPSVPGASNAYVFNGTSGYLASSQAVLFGNEWTFEVWFRLTSLPATGQTAWLFYSPGIGEIYVNENGTLVAQGATGYFYVTAYNFVVNTTYHVVVQGNTPRVLVNGVVQGVAINPPFAFGQGSNGVYIGSAVGTGTYFKGTMDELAFFNRCLSDDRVMAHYRTGLNLL